MSGNRSKSDFRRNSQAITMLLVVTFMKLHKSPTGFVKGLQRRFRISENLGFAKDFSWFTKVRKPI